MVSILMAKLAELLGGYADVEMMVCPTSSPAPWGRSSMARHDGGQAL